MRRLLVACALALLSALPAAVSQASRRVPGDGCLVVRDGRGIVTVAGKGYVFGRFDQGNVVIEDPEPGAGTVKVFGSDRTRPLSETRTIYIGDQVRFRASGRFKFRVNANSGIGLSVVGRGTAVLSSDDFLDAGEFSVDTASFCDDGFQAMPDVPTRYVIGGSAAG